MDRDFERLYRFTLESAFFVVRTKTNLLLRRHYSREVDPATGVHSDQTVAFASIESARQECEEDGGTSRYIGFFNQQRPQSSLNRLTPDQVYFNRLPETLAA